MGNTTSMKDPNEHQHGDVACTMKHGRKRRHHRTAKRSGHKRSGHKRSGHKRSGHKRRRSYSGGLAPITQPSY
jgi:hypothetical protein